MVDYRVRSLKWQKAHTQPLRYRLLILLQHPCQEPKSHSFQLPSFQKKISTVVNGERCIDSIKALLNCTMNDTCLYTKTMYSQVDILYWRGSHQAENTLKKKRHTILAILADAVMHKESWSVPWAPRYNPTWQSGYGFQWMMIEMTPLPRQLDVLSFYLCILSLLLDLVLPQRLSQVKKLSFKLTDTANNMTLVHHKAKLFTTTLLAKAQLILRVISKF